MKKTWTKAGSFNADGSVKDEVIDQLLVELGKTLFGEDEKRFLRSHRRFMQALAQFSFGRQAEFLGTIVGAVALQAKSDVLTARSFTYVVQQQAIAEIARAEEMAS